MTALALQTRIERWPIAGTFMISRGAKTEAVVVVVEISDGQRKSRGECVPYARYGETPEQVLAAIEAIKPDGIDRQKLRSMMKAGAARNALDCALWDLKAKQSGKRVWEFAGLAAPEPLVTAYTISLDTPDAMGAATSKVAARPLLKIKLGGPDDAACLAAVRAAAPKTELIVDANEGWKAENLAAHFEACKNAGVQMIEQPLPAANDAALTKVSRIIPICADESAHDTASLTALKGKYDAVNLKLDKCGGLTEMLDCIERAHALGLEIMIGCMVSTSLALAPAVIAASKARYVDLDGALLLAKDRENGLRYDGVQIYPPDAALWG